MTKTLLNRREALGRLGGFLALTALPLPAAKTALAPPRNRLTRVPMRVKYEQSDIQVEGLRVTWIGEI